MPKRNWKRINEALVRRGELLLDLDFVKGWGSELEVMNRGKEGAQFRYPDSFIRLLLFMHVYLHLPYRQLEGFIKALSKYVKGLKPPDHSSISWRAEKLPVKLDSAVMHSNEDVIIAVDATGIKVSNRGDWMRHQWKRRRGFLKIHIAVNVKKKRILALQVTEDRVGDGRMLEPLVEEASKKARVVETLGDGAYDTSRNFLYLAQKKIRPGIKARRPTRGTPSGCTARKLAIREYLSNPEGWKRDHSYGRRWMAETTISSYKRMFGEHVSAKKMSNMIGELMAKANLYNLFIGLTANL
ncbi:MAG: IS5 family transposase [archaeon]